MTLSDDIGVGSFLAHGGGGHDPVTGAVVPGIPVATTFARDDAYALISDDHVYVRDHDDAVRRVETVVQRLEAAAATRVFSSGMAAITAVVRSVRPGQTVLLQSSIYWAATATLRRLCAHHGIKLVEVDCVDTRAAEAAIAVERPALVLVEALSNPMLGVVDIPALAAATHSVGGSLVVDATVATPLSLPTLALGADLVLHSATKSMNGHSDVLAGVVSCRDADSERWAFIVAERAQAGAVLGPFGAFLLLRGLRTFALRHDRGCASALRLAELALAHPGAVDVLYPGLPSHPGHALAADQLTRGFGSLLSVRTAGGREGALRAAGALQLMVRATSLGGVESLVEHRFTVEQGVTDVPEDLLRISVGIEEPGDLEADLVRALDAAVS
ncbi:MAG: cystathionine gamma-synthase [Nonlabens sp.]